MNSVSEKQLNTANSYKPTKKRMLSWSLGTFPKEGDNVSFHETLRPGTRKELEGISNWLPFNDHISVSLRFY